MEWIDCKEKLPEDGHLVLVVRNFIFPEYDVHIQAHDIGRITDGRWKLESQQWCALPLNPTIDSNIISHWMELPTTPMKLEKEKNIDINNTED